MDNKLYGRARKPFCHFSVILSDILIYFPIRKKQTWKVIIQVLLRKAIMFVGMGEV